jgi:flagellar basal-body rod protein FlgB
VVNGIGDVTMGAVEYALRGLATRADVRAHNLANTNTPGFRATRVDFESTLKSALYRRDLDGVQAPSMSADPNLPGPNQNTVSVESEMVGQIKDNLMRSALVNAYNFKATALRTAIGRH